jgi:hypothetical protein
MDNYSIHKLQKDEFNLLIPIMRDCFGMDINVKYFEWKFKNNPAGFVEGYYAKHEDGEIAAYYGVIPEVYVINGEKRVIYQSCDTMTHSNHRRRGLFQKLAIHCYENLKKEQKLFIIGFGGGQSTPGFIKFGWKEIFKIKYYFYPRQFRIFNTCKFFEVVEIKNFKEIEHLTLKSNENAEIHSHKNADIFSWRVSNPLNNYKTVAIKDENQIYNSYITFYEQEDKIILFDYYIGDYQLGKQVFNYLKSLLNKRQKGIVSFIQENSPLSKTVVTYNFISNPFSKGPLSSKTPFIFFASDNELHQFNDKTKWLINSFDHDAI